MNILTEEQAKKRTCPFIRYCINERDALTDQGPPVYEHGICLASDCMGWVEVESLAPRPAGYCGLVGGAQ